MSLYPKSRELQEKASRLLVGGVNSPVRSFKAVGGEPLFIQTARGSKITDVDGNSYIDYVGAYGPAIIGHADKDVTNAVFEAAKKGLGYGANTPAEMLLARLVLEAYPFHDKIRFVNSGTEAVMSAVRLARGVTGKSKIIKFSGCYHGHIDDLLVAGGSGVATLSLPDSAGVTTQSAQNTIVVPYNDLNAVEKAFRQFSSQIAALVIEPVAGNMGLVLPQDGFLSELRKFCSEDGALLISDEIMCGFREGYKSVMSSFSAKADITCLGKIIGGGLPVGAYLGKSVIMDHLAPLGPVYQAGTMSGNPLVMAAGITTLKKIRETDFYRKINQKTTDICNAIQRRGIIANQFGSMFCIFFSNHEPQNFADVQSSRTVLYPAFFQKITREGLFVPPAPFETWFVSSAHSEQDIADTIQIINDGLNEVI
jgi:glutamate-1-semialdehyde 2,1-aminomutase